MADGGGAGGLFSFEGRINRGTFWKITLGMIVVVVVLGMGAAIVIPMLAGGGGAVPDAASPAASIGAGGTVGIVFAVLLYGAGIWISLATQAKRWHDLDKSAWMVLLNLIPLVGLIAWLYSGFAPGTAGQNRFGAAPQ